MSHRSKMIPVAAIAGLTALVLSGCSQPGTPSSETEDVALTFTWWGNDDRAARYQAAIDLYEEQNPHITINGSFSDYNSYWEKRTTEGAGGGLPDVMQFDYTRYRDYAERGQLLDLSAFTDDVLDVSNISESLLNTGVVDDTLFAVPTGSNVYAMFASDAAVASVGQPGAPISWEEYGDYLATFDTAAGLYGGSDYTTLFATFQLNLRQDGSDLFTEDGELGFDRDDLVDYWSSVQPVRDSGVFLPESRAVEVAPKTALGAGLVATQFNYDNLIATFAADLGSEELSLVPPPTDDPAAKDLYLKPALQLVGAADTDHGEAVADFIDFLTNDPEVGEIFGATRGIPASSTQMEGVELTGMDAAVEAYEEQVQDRLGDAPPAPPLGYASLEAKFQTLGSDINLGVISVQDAADQFFAEAASVLG